MIEVLSVFGTRPEAIKLAPVIRELREYPGRMVCKVCVTAQHRQMLDQVLRLFNIVPDYDLNVMEDNQTPTQVAAAVLARREPIYRQTAHLQVDTEGKDLQQVAGEILDRLNLAPDAKDPA